MGVKIAFGSAVFHISISKWGVEYHQAQICFIFLPVTVSIEVPRSKA